MPIQLPQMVDTMVKLLVPVRMVVFPLMLLPSTFDEVEWLAQIQVEKHWTLDS